ncbi:hypothetical protein GCU67_08085 [Modestobacter muralis]|uniref:XRE family transcriptional regulator n=1 Tax=Modestobacter muralis TaxID=1608614 RepID=A0A6P0ETG9_9ACTN|nr:hypothetical protein [Modestobacter muralis]NEK94133.1 hypothetical protein [Modestobacter muralis]NEN50900.1 hypothetical protein [Modestobacter muralis]
MSHEDLQRLIWRRLFELGLTAEEASARTLGVVSKEAVRGLVGGRTSVYVNDRVARALARALDVPENRVRRTAGLPVEEAESARTGPHLRIVR